MINLGCFFGLISLLHDWCELQLLSDLITVGLLDQPEQTLSVSFICAILFSFCILMDRTFNYFSCQMKLKLFRLTCFGFFFFPLSQCSTEVIEGQFQINSLQSLRETRWNGNSESAWTQLLWLLAVLQQFFRWMSVPNHNYLISVMFPCGAVRY